MLIRFLVASCFHHEIIGLVWGNGCGIVVCIECLRKLFVSREVIALSHPRIVVEWIGSKNLLCYRHRLLKMAHLLMTIEHTGEGTNIIGMVSETMLVEMHGRCKITCIHESEGNIVSYVFVWILIGECQISHLHGFGFSAEHSQCGRTEDAEEGVVVLKNRINFLQCRFCVIGHERVFGIELHDGGVIGMQIKAQTQNIFQFTHLIIVRIISENLVYLNRVEIDRFSGFEHSFVFVDDIWSHQLLSSSLTLAEMIFPSAKPASALVAVPMTLPISLGP